MRVSKYKIGDRVIISHVLTPEGVWLKISPKTGIVKNVRDTPSMGFAYSIELDGKVQIACYWESDIDGSE